MYRILLADDEDLEREGLEWIIRRSFPDRFEVIHAANGRAAIEKAEDLRPQVVFMDVNMPGIQGLAALREIRSRAPETKLVLVTAYDYFSYAKEAVSLGVKEYIVKPARQDQIVTLLRQLLEELDQDKLKRAEELELRDRMSQLMPLVENELALMVMAKPALDDEGKQFAAWLRYPLDRGIAVVAAFPDSGHVGQEKKLFRSFHGLATAFGPSVSSALINRHMAIFLRKPPGPSETDWLQEIRFFGEQLIRQAQQLFHLFVTIGIGTLSTGTEGLHQSYFEAVFASTFGEEGNELWLFDELKSEDSARFKQHKDRLASPDASPLYVTQALEQIREEREQETVSVLDKARQYIRERYAEELSLDEVADYVHLNAFYFSKIFKQQYGETFIDYLTGLRIAKAKELIERGELSLKEICFRVGYKDPNYFSRVFRKVTGIAPSDYRERQS
ncbi:AraC family transcriptional regulator [Gorillibacterium timonense]|uniref:AraC family transcriptional regulator n=1 Tax=Gorillibacterium timonense TaxID=1689269 RepID=UPI00071C528B|nr:AraC family transcriptional regulator [Gorillibacterium timonense]